MRIFRFFGIEIKTLFTLNRVKRLTFDIPCWADDCYVHNSDGSEAVIRYWRGGEAYYIKLPKCIRAKEISVSRMYCIVDDNREYAQNRKIVVDVYTW